MPGLLVVFVALRLGQQIVEHALTALNRRYAFDPVRLAEAAKALGIPAEELDKTKAYAADGHRFGRVASWVEVLATLAFVAAGGLSWADSTARAAAGGLGSVASGLAFFAVLGVIGFLFGLPFAIWSTFVVEQRHGFNRQTPRSFALDQVKGLALAAALGAPLLAAILLLIERAGPSWWLGAWAVAGAFSVLTAWIYPTLLAPLFNRFTPLPEGELKDRILELARRTGFRAGGVFVMDASRRSAHGNAYFTGLFGQKRIVLFDTLLEALAPREVVAVLAHELGHFRLHHVRWGLLRSVVATGLLFFALSRALPLTSFYRAFGLEPSAHAALVVFGLWLGPVLFSLQPLTSALSRRHEFAADAFALRAGSPAADLAAALRKLRERSRMLPLAHPLYSRVYHSHPPLLERLRALGEA
jgi:STE24 endopeptidase